MKQVDVLLIGGGLAGLIAAQELALAGHEVLLVERKTYPFHKVCGEYISKEVLPLLERLQLDPFALGAQDIQRLHLTSPRGRLAQTSLPLGAFSLSRYTLDHALYHHALVLGANVRLDQRVESVLFEQNHHIVQLSDGTEYQARIVIGAYGKRTLLDRKLQRDFFQQRSPWLGVKYHARLDFPDDLVELHNFRAGYCGISRVEGADTVNICFLTSRKHLRQHKNVPALIQAVLHQNPLLKTQLEAAASLFEQPLVINEISFARKELVADHILMAGDAAGMIMPLCGNGMAMAMHGAWMLAGWVNAFLQGRCDRPTLENAYRRDWERQFQLRLWAGRQLQQMFSSTFWAETAVWGLEQLPPLGRYIIRKTHGQQFGAAAYVAKP